MQLNAMTNMKNGLWINCSIIQVDWTNCSVSNEYGKFFLPNHWKKNDLRAKIETNCFTYKLKISTRITKSQHFDLKKPTIW